MTLGKSLQLCLVSMTLIEAFRAIMIFLAHFSVSFLKSQLLRGFSPKVESPYIHGFHPDDRLSPRMKRGVKTHTDFVGK